MEFNTKLKEEFPFLSSLLSEYSLNPEGTDDFSLEEEAFSSKGLFYNLHHLDNSHLINNTPLITPSYLDHFTMEGSSKNPFSGICTDPAHLDSLAGDFSSHDLNACKSTPLLPAGCGDRLLHGLPGGPVREYDYQKIFEARSLSQKEMKGQRKFEEIGLMSAANNGVSTDGVSCVSTEDSKYHKQADHHHRKARKLMLEKDSKVDRRSHVIKGQWSPQEDR